MFDIKLVDVAGIGALSAEQLMDSVGASYRMESALTAWRLAAIAALLAQHRDVEGTDVDFEYAFVDALNKTSAEVSTALNVSAAVAAELVDYAETLDTRLPRVAASLAAGDIDWRTVKLIIDRTDSVDDWELMAELDAWFVERIGRWQGWSRRRVITAIDKRLLTVDPDAAKQRRRSATDRRDIGITATPNGMAKLWGSVDAADATAFDCALSQLAKSVCSQDPRTMAQRRADALRALTGGSTALACQCGRPTCPARPGGDESTLGHPPVVINVIATADTLAGSSNEPAYIDGYGVIDAEQLRELAAAASQRLIDKSPLDAGALCYRPSAALQRAIRCRDLACRFPGCDRPAGICDLDHTIPFDHNDPAAGGLTVPGNMKCLCRHHHRLKTHCGGPSGWRDQQLPDGTIVWTSPAGQTHRTTPAGAELFNDAPPRRRRTRARRRSTRIARSRARNHLLRPVNDAARTFQQCRKAEIEARKSRNHMRDMLFLFKGTPATSPFCTWINEPKEPEELPPDWQPPPKSPVADDPPF